MLVQGNMQKKLQQLQFRGRPIKILYQYNIDGERIITIITKMNILHCNLNLSYLEIRCRRHLLKIMYDLIYRKPNLLEERNRERILRSDKCIHFVEERITFEI